MILVFALAGTFTATIAGVTALMMGHSWWMGLVSYIGTGMLTVFVLALFAAITLKLTPRKAGFSAGQVSMTMAKQ